MMSIKTLIEKKKEGAEHSQDELSYLVNEFIRGSIPDYQMSAWLMAVCFQGMSFNELSCFTRLMWKTGTTFPRNSKDSFWIDKHSTGGVGDKLSLLLVPLIAAFCEEYLYSKQIQMPMVSGRGLGFTGGTLDKLESVKNFSSALSLEKAARLIEKNGYVMMGQTQEMAPCDRKMYALRDATGTVSSAPLIVASILSKKLSENLDGLVLDVKFGAGATIKEFESSLKLAQLLVKIASENQCETIALMTDMNEPLGKFSGNAFEVYECLKILKGESRESRQWEVTSKLFANLIFLGTRKKISCEEAIEKLDTLIKTKKPFLHFENMFVAQGGDLKKFESQFEQETSLLKASEINAKNNGFLDEVKTDQLGYLLIEIGGGRNRKEDLIDPYVGIESLAKRGEMVKAGQPIFRVYARKPLALEGGNYYSLSKEPKNVKMVTERIV